MLLSVIFPTRIKETILNCKMNALKRTFGPCLDEKENFSVKIFWVKSLITIKENLQPTKGRDENSFLIIQCVNSKTLLK